MKVSIRRVLFSMVILMSMLMPFGISTSANAASLSQEATCALSPNTYKPRFISSSSAIEFGGAAKCTNGVKTTIRLTITLYKNNAAFTTKSFTCYNASTCSQNYHINGIASPGTWHTIVISNATGASTVSVVSPSLVIRLTSSMDE